MYIRRCMLYNLITYSERVIRYYVRLGYFDLKKFNRQFKLSYYYNISMWVMQTDESHLTLDLRRANKYSSFAKQKTFFYKRKSIGIRNLAENTHSYM